MKTEISQDSRLLIFAAFNDQGKVVERLLDAGFELQQLDCLVALEIQRDLDRPQLLKADAPPKWWVNSQFQAGADPALVSTRWRRVEDKESIYRAISWQNMPSLPGWTMMVDTVEPKGHWPEAMIIQQLSSNYLDFELPPGGRMVRKFIVVSPPNLAGKVFSSEDEERTEANAPTREGGIICAMFQDGDTKITTELFPLFKDNVTEWLPLDSQCRFRLPSRHQNQERRRVLRSFANWLHHGETQEETLANPGATGNERKPKFFPNRQMHELHRLYWAIRSNRPRLATVLMTRCSSPLLAGLFSAEIYKRQFLPADFVPDARLKPKYLPMAMQEASEVYAVEILDHAELDGSNAAFDSFLFYSLDEEDSDDYIDFVTKESEQIENANTRTVLHLMGVNPLSKVTNIDLALLAGNKHFMAQTGIRQFLLKLWARPSDNGNWVQRQLPSILGTPQVKGMLNLLGAVVFLVLYIIFISAMPPRGEPFEATALDVLFWGWALTLVLNEVAESMNDFQTWLDYVRASGNALDCVVCSLFCVAFVCRMMPKSDDDDPTATGDSSQIWVDWMYALLCGNLVLCCLRFLLLLAMFERIGVMVIIVRKVMMHDIAPFLVFATTAITAFESAAVFFSWILGLERYFGYFFQMFTGVGRVSGEMFGGNPNGPEWDTDVSDVEVLSSSFQLLFWTTTMIVLMNLLVAMCA